jgi:hypothetical protein
MLDNRLPKLSILSLIGCTFFEVDSSKTIDNILLSVLERNRLGKVHPIRCLYLVYPAGGSYGLSSALFESLHGGASRLWNLTLDGVGLPGESALDIICRALASEECSLVSLILPDSDAVFSQLVLNSHGERDNFVHSVKSNQSLEHLRIPRGETNEPIQ